MACRMIQIWKAERGWQIDYMEDHQRVLSAIGKDKEVVMRLVGEIFDRAGLDPVAPAPAVEPA